MKRIQSLLDKVIYPLLVAVLLPTVMALGSRIATGDWLEWFGLIPKPLWIVLLLGVLAWVVIILIRKRLKQIRKSDVGPPVGVLPRYGWITIGEREYAGVIWKIRLPRPSPYSSTKLWQISASRIDVATPPRCPNCKTELEQSRSFCGGYVWRCVACGFNRRNPDGYYREAERVEKIARRAWEELQAEERRKQS